jgi:hypothetical protein
MFYTDSPQPNPARKYHWSPAKQHRFLARLAETGSVQQACDAVAMARTSAYRLRRRADAVVFRIGWDAAMLIAYQRHGDDLAIYAHHPVEMAGERHPVTGRIRWRVVDPALARGRGLTLYSRLEKVVDDFVRRPKQYAMTWVAMEHFPAVLAQIKRGASDEAVLHYLARGGGVDTKPFYCNLSQNSAGYTNV